MPRERQAIPASDDSGLHQIVDHTLEDSGVAAAKQAFARFFARYPLRQRLRQVMRGQHRHHRLLQIVDGTAGDEHVRDAVDASRRGERGGTGFDVLRRDAGA